MVSQRKTSRRGANAVEFALTFPVFILILFGMIDFGAYFTVQAMVDMLTTDECRQGAMLDPLREDAAGVTNGRLRERLATLPFVDCGELSCEVTVNDIGEVPGRSMTCEVIVVYQPLTGFIDMPDNIISGSMMRYEWQRQR